MSRVGVWLARLVLLTLGLLIALVSASALLLLAGHVADAERMLAWIEWVL
jgi:hypothetical protein